MPIERPPKAFLTNQSKATIKLISTLAAQMATPKEREHDNRGDCGFHGWAV